MPETHSREDVVTWLAEALDGEAIGDTLRFKYRDDDLLVRVPAGAWAEDRANYERDGAVMWSDVSPQEASFRLLLTHLWEVLETRDPQHVAFVYKGAWFEPG